MGVDLDLGGAGPVVRDPPPPAALLAQGVLHGASEVPDVRPHAVACGGGGPTTAQSLTAVRGGQGEGGVSHYQGTALGGGREGGREGGRAGGKGVVD